MLSFYLSMVDDDNDKEKVERIYEKYRQFMYKKAYSILKHEQDAEDAVHEAFVRIINHLNDIYSVDDAKTLHFVMIITENISLKTLNRNKKHDSLTDDFAETKLFYPDDTDKIAIKNALEKLPEQYYQILCLTDYLGYTVKKAAVLLGISDDSAYKRLQRARAKMAQLLEKEGMLNV